MTKKKILTCGPLLADFVVETGVPGSEKLDAIVEELGFAPGSKNSIDRATSKELAKNVRGRKVTITPGGSSFNATLTLKSMLGDQVDVNFLGMLGHGPLADMIQGAFEDAGVKLVPPHFNSNPPPETGISYALTPPDGSRAYAVYNGNAREVFNPSAIPDLEKLVKDSDVVMLSGSAWERVSPELADEMMRLRWEHNKELVLSLPVGRMFSEQEAHKFRWRIPSANVVLANEEELARTYGIDDPKQALELLKNDFEKSQLSREKVDGKWNGNTGQVGFITFGKEGAYLVVRDRENEVDGQKKYTIKKVEPEMDPPGKLYKGGAGDTSFAGFLLGHFNGLDPELSAQIAMKLASAKLTHPEPRLPNPQDTFRELMPKVADKVFGTRSNGRVNHVTSGNGVSV
jgi:sugar/nucleoside kinase (ribokinase family)